MLPRRHQATFLLALGCCAAYGLLLPTTARHVAIGRGIRPQPATMTVNAWFDDTGEEQHEVEEPKEQFVVLGGRRRRASTINIAVLGSGSFGTAMAVYLGGKGCNVGRRPSRRPPGRAPPPPALRRGR